MTATPENSETPLDTVRGWVTPTPLFFVRNHFDPPKLDLDRWCLRVEGCVDHAIEWSWQELLDMPERTVFATVECAGNGRSFLEPRMPGVAWGAGEIGHAGWTGVPVRYVLERAKLHTSGLEVLFEGADQGTEPDHPERMHFARSLPLAKALDPDTLLAIRMNGELLEPVHGAPLRLFVPGWYGVASVKWLSRIEVIEKPFRGYFQTKKYTFQRRTPGGMETEIIGPMAVKSEIIRPRKDEVLGIGTNRVVGLAWAGEEAIAEVNVSTDGGRTWMPGILVGPRAPYSWNMWQYLWEQPQAGTFTLLARATSAAGRVQPSEYDPLYLGYMIQFSRPLTVQVRADSRSDARGGNLDALLFDINAYAEENRRMPLDVDAQYCEGSGI
ncbi:MAG: sulfite oxidase [Gemmataceae bacterium]|nr:sulfite oxidase [Gemmataceae bacterium]